MNNKTNSQRKKLALSKKSLDFFGESRTYARRMRKKKQGWATLNPELSKNLIDDIEYFCRNLTRPQQLVLNYLFHMSHRHKYIYPTQTTIARYANLSRQQCNKILDRFEKLGLIASCYRHMQSCYYKVSTFFKNPFIRSQLSHLFDAFRLISYLVLTQLNIQGRKGINIIEKTFKTNRRRPKINQGPRIFKKFTNPEENIMEKLSRKVFGDNPISPEIRKLTSLNLTKWGQIKLSAFPDEVIRYASQKYQYTKDIKNPFNWFFKVCLDYSNRSGINPDWTWVKQLANSYKMPENAPMLLERSLRPLLDTMCDSDSTDYFEPAPSIKHIPPKIKKSTQTQPKATNTPIEELRKVEEYRKTNSWKLIEKWIGKPLYPFGVKPIRNHENHSEN